MLPRKNALRLSRVAALFVALTLIATYPIILAPGSYAYFDHSDAQLNMWILAWDAHALHHAPFHLFDANIFYPTRGTLAYSETLLGYLPIFGPVLWLHGSPALAFNAIIFFSFIASGIGMYLLARHLTGREWPSIVAGIVYAFTPYRFVHFPQIQLQSMEWFPLAFLCLHLFYERGERRYAAGVGVFVVMEALCCVYYAIFLVIALVVAAAVLAARDARARDGRAVVTLLIVGCLTAITVVPLAGEYVRVHRTQHLERSFAEISRKSAVPASYLASPARLHQRLWASTLQTPRDYLFPGIVAAILAAIGFAGRRSVVLTYAAIAVVGLVASFGPPGVDGVSLYDLFYSSIPIFHGLRQVSRFGVLVIFGVSVLAALGAAIVESRLRAGRAVLCVALAGAVFLELLVAPLRADRPGGVALVHVPPTPPVYTWLAQQEGPFAIVEFPYAHHGQFWENAPYVYWSTIHWHGLVDAYSGFAAPDYGSLERILAGFPDDLSRQALLLRHVRYVIVHHDLYREWHVPLNFDRIHRTGWLQPVATFPNVDVFWLRPDDRLLTYAGPR